MERKLRVGIVFGGRSGEHEVSVASARSIMAAIDKSRYEVVPIARSGQWIPGVEPQALMAPGDAPASPEAEAVASAAVQVTGFARLPQVQGASSSLGDL